MRTLETEREILESIHQGDTIRGIPSRCMSRSTVCFHLGEVCRPRESSARCTSPAQIGGDLISDLLERHAASEGGSALGVHSRCVDGRPSR
jgi:hypothetical protein